MNNRSSFAIALPLVLVIGFFAGTHYQKDRNDDPLQLESDATASEIASRPEFRTFWEVWNLLHEEYVDKDTLNEQDLVYGATEGLINSIDDPHSVFFPPKESKAFEEQINGSFSGVGIEIGIRNDVLTVISPIKNTPAERAKIQASDIILRIDETSTDGMKVDRAVELIRGEGGTTVTLLIDRGSFDQPREFALVREKIKIPAVSLTMIENDIAHLEVHVFNQNVDEEFRKAAQEILESPAKKILLDLRNNPGGLLDSSINLAGYFLDPDQPVLIERLGDGTEHVFKASVNGRLKNYPVVILANKGSASASEILAGALRDNRNISLVGETTFGKGSVQDVFELPRGASAKITIAKWLTPNGTSIHGNGLIPDVDIELTEEDIEADRDPQFDKAVELLKAL